MIPQEISDVLKATFGDAVLESRIDGVLDPFVKVAPGPVKDVALFLRDNEQMLFDVLMCLSGVDYTGGRLGVVYHLHSMKRNHKLVVKTEVTVDDPHVASVESVWKTANWHEREAFDLYGIVFDGHPDLRRILMPYDWQGHPLRKDYKVPEFYNGMKVPY
jgi:NADH-quinone oxidoreductase subunit C